MSLSVGEYQMIVFHLLTARTRWYQRNIYHYAQIKELFLETICHSIRIKKNRQPTVTCCIFGMQGNYILTMIVIIVCNHLLQRVPEKP